MIFMHNISVSNFIFLFSKFNFQNIPDHKNKPHTIGSIKVLKPLNCTTLKAILLSLTFITAFISPAEGPLRTQYPPSIDTEVTSKMQGMNPALVMGIELSPTC